MGPSQRLGPIFTRGHWRLTVVGSLIYRRNWAQATFRCQRIGKTSPALEPASMAGRNAWFHLHEKTAPALLTGRQLGRNESGGQNSERAGQPNPSSGKCPPQMAPRKGDPQVVRAQRVEVAKLAHEPGCGSGRYARALEPTFAGYGRRRAGAKRITPIVPASTGPMLATSSEGGGTRRSQWSRSWPNRLGPRRAICSIRTHRFPGATAFGGTAY